MPTYNFRNRTTGEIEVREMRIAEMEAILAADSNLDVVPSSFSIGDSMLAEYKKSDRRSRFNEVIRDIKRCNPGNTIDGTDV